MTVDEEKGGEWNREMGRGRADDCAILSVPRIKSSFGKATVETSILTA
jgi:hypothetical protein